MPSLGPDNSFCPLPLLSGLKMVKAAGKVLHQLLLLSWNTAHTFVNSAFINLSLLTLIVQFIFYWDPANINLQYCVRKFSIQVSGCVFVFWRVCVYTQCTHWPWVWSQYWTTSFSKRVGDSEPRGRSWQVNSSQLDSGWAEGFLRPSCLAGRPIAASCWEVPKIRFSRQSLLTCRDFTMLVASVSFATDTNILASTIFRAKNLLNTKVFL